jgi:hypothetical protein
MKPAPTTSTSTERRHIPRDILEHLDIIVIMLLLQTQAVGIILTLMVFVHTLGIGIGVEISSNIVAQCEIRMGRIFTSG